VSVYMCECVCVCVACSRASALNVDFDLSKPNVRVCTAVNDVERVVAKGLEPRGENDHRLLARVPARDRVCVCVCVCVCVM
jgi:hypothetical protein